MSDTKFFLDNGVRHQQGKELKMGSKIPSVYGEKYREWVRVVCRVFMVKPESLWSLRGSRRVVLARQLLYAMIFRELKSFTETAAIFNRTHGAVWHGIRSLKARCGEDEQVRDWVQEVGGKLGVKMF